MATITPGSGGTITATTLEAFFVSAVRRMQTLEKSTTYNPNAANNATSSVSDDSSSFSATITLPIAIVTDGDGGATYTAVDYFVNASSQYSAGTGGTITADNLPKAVFESALRISALEIQAAKNPDNYQCLSWTISKTELGNVNQGTFSLTVTGFPLEIVDGGDSQTTKGKPYLL